ncbi:hypothetical protein FH972_022317 [Carpinus fangiana]|uniref:Zn(2)-C6 fungal-type domain-containing protein n=1 Tax=Carpinus fangiana TaxID=176857 RepID=A0A5N6KRX1_9ROSI|nr:hypothetical protein FH972_022317 [Carpinus fangiana]
MPGARLARLFCHPGLAAARLACLCFRSRQSRINPRIMNCGAYQTLLRRGLNHGAGGVVPSRSECILPPCSRESPFVCCSLHFKTSSRVINAFSPPDPTFFSRPPSLHQGTILRPQVSISSNLPSPSQHSHSPSSLATASYPGPISLPPLSADKFTHGDFGKPSLAESQPSWWSGTDSYYPSPPLSGSPTTPAPQSLPATSFYASGHPSSAFPASADQRAPACFAGGFTDGRTPGADSSSHSSHPFSLARSLPQPDSAYERKFSVTTGSNTVSLSQPSNPPSTRNDSFTSAGPTEANSPPGNHNALQSQRGRKAKAHVQSACANCKKAHLACDIGRPCQRCISNGKTATCVDVEHKKRGRPRLRDDRGQKTAAASRFPHTQPLHLNSASAARELRPSSLRGQYSTVLASQDLYSRRFGNDVAYMGPNSYFSSGFSGAQSAMAFLDTDMNIVRTNDAFRQYFPGAQLEGQKLLNIVDSSNWRTLEYIQRQLRDERHSKDNTYLPPIQSENEARNIPESVEMTDVGQLTGAHIDRTQPLNFRLVNGQTQTLNVSIRLAKAMSYFVVLRVIPNHVSEDSMYAAGTPYFSQSASFNSSYSQPSSYSGGYALASGPAPQSMNAYATAGSQSPFYGMQSVASPAGMAGRSDTNFNFVSNSASIPRGSQASSFYYPQNGINMAGHSASAPSSAIESRLPPYYFGQDLAGHPQQAFGGSLPQHSQGQTRHQSFGQHQQSGNVQLPPLSTHSNNSSRHRTMAPPGMTDMPMMNGQHRPGSSSMYAGDEADDGGNRKKRKLDIPGLV